MQEQGNLEERSRLFAKEVSILKTTDGELNVELCCEKPVEQSAMFRSLYYNNKSNYFYNFKLIMSPKQRLCGPTSG